MATDNIREAQLQSIEDGLQRLKAEADQLEAIIAEKLAARKAHREGKLGRDERLVITRR